MRKALVLLIGLYLLLYLVPLGERPLIARDEFRYGEIPREMLASGEYIVPHLNGLPYFEKPILGYWLNAASMAMLGRNRFALRLPSALATGGCAVLVAILLLRVCAARVTAVLGAAIFLSSILVLAIGTFNVLDAPFTFFLCAALTYFFLGDQEPVRRRKRIYLILFGLFCGLAFLTKGFLAFALPPLVILPYLIWERRWRELPGAFWLPAVAATTLVLPLCLAVHFRAPEYWEFFFWNEHVHRFLSEDAQHSQPFWYFLPVLLAGALPWSGVFPAAWPGIARHSRDCALIRFAICWLVFPFLFFSASRGKLATYILPLFPALAIILAVGLQAWLEKGRERPFCLGSLFMATLGTALAGFFVVVRLGGFTKLEFHGSDQVLAWVLVVLTLSCWAGGAAWAALANLSRDRRLMWFAVSPLPLMVSLPIAFPSGFAGERAPAAFFRSHVDWVDPTAEVVTEKRLVHAACWVFERADIYLTGSPGELAYGLHQPQSRGRLLTPQAIALRVAALEPGRHLVLILRERHYRRLDSMLPRPERIARANGLVLAFFAAHREV